MRRAEVTVTLQPNEADERTYKWQYDPEGGVLPWIAWRHSKGLDAPDMWRRDNYFDVATFDSVLRMIDALASAVTPEVQPS